MANIIAAQKMVKIHYTLTDEKGDVLDSSREQGPIEYMHGVGSLIPGLERQIEGKAVGEKLSVVVEPKEAYGEYDDSLVYEVPRKQFAAEKPIEVGDSFEAQMPTGPFTVRVTKVTDDMITVDGNHQYAGKKLFFDIEVVDVREPDANELSQYESSCDCGGSCGGGCGGCGGCGGDCGCGE